MKVWDTSKWTLKRNKIKVNRKGGRCLKPISLEITPGSQFAFGNVFLIFCIKQAVLCTLSTMWIQSQVEVKLKKAHEEEAH